LIKEAIAGRANHEAEMDIWQSDNDNSFQVLHIAALLAVRLPVPAYCLRDLGAVSRSLSTAHTAAARAAATATSPTRNFGSHFAGTQSGRSLAHGFFIGLIPGFGGQTFLKVVN
jgi:hypothetical protein